MQCKYLYWLYFNKYKITTIPLLQPHPQATAFLLATMWFARTPSDAFCYHKHTMSCLPFVLDVLPLVIYNHTSSQRASVHITLVAIYPSNTFIPNFYERSSQRKIRISHFFLICVTGLNKSFKKSGKICILHFILP